MAQVIAVSVYGINQNAIGTSAGQPWAFPSTGVLVRPVIDGQVFNGVTQLSIIQLPPTGLNKESNQYYTAKTVAELVTLANA